MNTREMMRDISSDIARDISFQDGAAKPLWNVDFTTGALPSGLTFTRASGGNAFNSAGVLTAAASNVARLDYYASTLKPRGLLLEETRTNYLLNNATPSTQTVTLAAGTYTLWLVGSGSCVAAAGTAVGTGFATATASAAVTFTVTTAGTVSFTVSGGVVRFQCENGAYATSFITTAGTATTRAADVIYIDAIGSWYNAAEGTLVVEYESMGFTSTQRVVATQAVATETDGLYLSLNTGTLALNVKSANVTVAAMGMGAMTAGAIVKVAGAYKLDDFAACANGGSVITDAAGAIPVGISRMYLGVRSGGTSQVLNGWIRKVAYYPTRLPNATLQQLTI